MSITGKEAHEFLLKNKARECDLLLGYREREISVSLIETAYPENGRNKPIEWYRLKDVINGYDGYPTHYMAQVFPVYDLCLYRPAFKDPLVALQIIQHGQQHDSLSFVACFKPDKSARAELLRSEAYEVEKQLERNMERLDKSVAEAKATVKRTREDFIQRITDLLGA